MSAACGRDGTGDDHTAARMPLHLEERLAEAQIAGEVTSSDLEPLYWSLDKPDRSVTPLTYPEGFTSRIDWSENGLVVKVDKRDSNPGGAGFLGGIVVPVPSLDHADWGDILVRARSRGATWLNAGFNLGERYVEDWGIRLPVRYLAKGTALNPNGQTHVYRLSADALHPELPAWDEGEAWRELILNAWSPTAAELEILSVEIRPRTEGFDAAAAGVRTERRGLTTRRTLYSHVPAEIAYRVNVPAGGRLDVGLAVLQRNKPATFSITAAADGEQETLLSERVDSTEWQQRSVDLSAFEGRDITLGLNTDGEPGTVAFWGAPTVGGSPVAADATRPNVIFYVIDGAGADLMSLHGYNRRTTPNLERIAAEGVVFENAYSNSAWTKPSTASFMTSLHQSVLGGFRTLQDRIPEDATTMAEHFHRSGYQTAVLTGNPWAGSLSGLEEGVDWFRDYEREGHHSTSSARLHEQFWLWRQHYPGRPYWVHFQTVDVHEPHEPVAPFAGMFVRPEHRQWFHETWKKLQDSEAGSSVWQLVKDPRNTLAELYRERLQGLEVDPREFFNTQRGLYDETMAHQDYQLGRLVERLKASGEWDNTLLIVASDHGHPAGSFSRFGRELFEPLPDSDEGALLDSYRTHIPLVFVWPKSIPAGGRVAEQVSMMDVLPTVLELTGLPAPKLLQGQSLVPLLYGKPGWQVRPVILEQLQPVPGSSELVGHIEMIDGRWGASLEIWPEDLDPETARPVGNQRAARPHRPGMPRLYLYDLWQDPFARRRVNDEYPALVEEYTRRLEAQWQAHQALATQFEPGVEVELTPEQLERLRSLGYIQ